jgi:hypothetical protein
MQSYLVGVLSQLPLPQLLPILQLLRHHMQSTTSYLFDTAANLTADGSSLDAGSDYLRRIFGRANPTVNLAAPLCSGPTDFITAFINSFQPIQPYFPDRNVWPERHQVRDVVCAYRRWIDFLSGILARKAQNHEISI